MEIHLTKAQQIQIKASAKVKVAPTKLMIFMVKDLEHDCTCFASNWAFPFKPGWLEIPIVWVCSDKEAEDNRATD
jgi:hypothetical protein